MKALASVSVAVRLGSSGEDGYFSFISFQSQYTRIPSSYFTFLSRLTPSTSKDGIFGGAIDSHRVKIRLGTHGFGKFHVNLMYVNLTFLENSPSILCNVNFARVVNVHRQEPITRSLHLPYQPS